MNIEENNSMNKKNNIMFKNKNTKNLTKKKNAQLDPFTYGRNKENLITLKKLNYNHNHSINNFIAPRNIMPKK